MKNLTAVFPDIGGVLLTDGWSLESRHSRAEKFQLDIPEMETRHGIAFDTYELGKLTLDEYLNIVVFYEQRPFTKDEFRQFMFAQSQQPYPEMVELIKRIKKRYELKVVTVSNEARDLNVYSTEKYKLTDIIDIFVSSTFAHLCKPAIDIIKLALDIAQTRANETIYMEDRAVFVGIAESMGIKGICHGNYETTCKKLQSFGFETTI